MNADARTESDPYFTGKKMPGNLKGAGQTALGGEIAKDRSLALSM